MVHVIPRPPAAGRPAPTGGLARRRTTVWASPLPSPPRRPALGLTGFAVLMVTMSNLGLPLPGSYLAIDLLLVTVGFDLARRVLEPSSEGHRLKHFWLGRAGQIIAPTVVAVALVAGYAQWHNGLGQPELGAVVGAMTMTLNFFAVSGNAHFPALDHLWVTALIVQFSLVVPLLVLPGRRFLDPERRMSIIIGLAAGVAICRLGFLMTGFATPQAIAMNTFTRVDGLLIGLTVGIAPVATLRRRIPTRLAPPAFVALLFLLVIAPDVGEFPELGLGMLAPMTAVMTAIVLGAAAGRGHRGALAATLDNQVMRWLGARVFSIYLWHHIFGVTLNREIFGSGETAQDWPGIAIFIVRLVFTLAAAATSYRYLELPAMMAVTSGRVRCGRWFRLVATTSASLQPPPIVATRWNRESHKKTTIGGTRTSRDGATGRPLVRGRAESL